jgi:glycosyltransferase involved in cell wall biosynthesis
MPEYFMRKFSVTSPHPIVSLLQSIEKIACRYADHVITVTHIWYWTLTQRSVSPDKCTVIMNVPDPELFRKDTSKRTPDRPGCFTLLYPGNLGEHFGVDTAIKAMGLIRERLPDVKLQIVGTGQEESRLIELRDSLELQSSVEFSRRRFPLESIPSVMEQADVGIVPKKGGVFADEALSTKLLEFAIMGLPIIVSRTKASERYFDPTMVRYFEADDEADLARAIMELHASPALRRRLTTNAFRISESYNWMMYKRVYFHLIDNLCCSEELSYDGKSGQEVF